MHKLKPCPFCGGAAEIDTLQAYRNITTGRIENAIAVYCTSCSASMSVCYADVPNINPEQVADMWNKRENEKFEYGPNNPPRLRKTGESLDEYRASMGWPTETPNGLLGVGFEAKGQTEC